MTREVVQSILEDCFRELSKIESVSKFNTQNGFIESWEIRIEIPYSTFQKEADLIISFPFTFPITPPKLFLEEVVYDETKYLPHVNFDRSICLFDESFTSIDAKRPFEIITECIKKAKSVLQLGLEQNNTNDFSEEIQAYWVHKYHKKDNISREYLSLLAGGVETSKTVKLLEIIPSKNRVTKYFLVESSDCEFILHLEEKGYKFKEFEALYLDDFDLKMSPPYDYTNISFLESLTPLNRKIFNKYINNNLLPHVFFSKSDKILGFRIAPLNINLKGFRQGVLTPSEVMKTFQRNDYLYRINVEKYNPDRIEKRTSGFQYDKFKFLLVGLGSIGSNLAYFLNAINYPSFTFVDNDSLSIDNIGRHFLGFEAVRYNKAEVLRYHFKDIRPDQNIVTKNASIQSILIKDTSIFNDNDFAFLCIGNQNVENYIIDLINSKKITTPTFILWVEPFLLGGHCVFIHPNKPISKDQLFKNQNYRYNVISDKSYDEKKEMFLMREAGCQTSYMPYSANHIILFLSQVYCHIDSQIKSQKEESFIIRWTGDLDLANSLGVVVDNELAKKYNVEQIQY